MAIYSQRLVRGRCERFCNLAAWCVLPEFRSQGIRLLRALLAQKGYHFTDFSPSGNVVALNRLLKFREINTSTSLFPNLMYLPSKSVQIYTSPNDIQRLLSGNSLQIYKDHKHAQASLHLAIRASNRVCYVIARKERRKRMHLFASILYVSDPDIWSVISRQVLRYLLIHHRTIATLIDRQVASANHVLAFRIPSSRIKMFLSQTLAANDIDYLYSELTCVPW